MHSQLMYKNIVIHTLELMSETYTSSNNTATHTLTNVAG